MLIATMYTNVNVTSLYNSGTADLHVMLLIVIIMYKTFKYSHGKEKYYAAFSCGGIDGKLGGFTHMNSYARLVCIRGIKTTVIGLSR